MRKSHSSLHAKVLAILAFSAACALGQTTLYWDANSSLGGNGTWDVNTTQNWSTVNAAGAPNSKWTPNDGTMNAVFNGSGAYTVNIASGATINANSLTLGNSNSNTTISGGTALDIASSTASIIMNTNTGNARAQIINAPIGTMTAGADLTVVSNAGPTPGGVTTLLTLAGNNTFSGNLNISGSDIGGSNSRLSEVNINTQGALPAGVAVNFARNFGNLLFTAGGASGTTALIATYNNPINLNTGNTAITYSSEIGSSINGSLITLTGLISGNSDFIDAVGTSGGQGTIILDHANNTWTGQTKILTAAQGILRLGVSNAIPQTSNLSFAGTTVNVGAFDMAGFNQQIAGLNSTTTGTIGGIVNTGASTSMLTISGNAVSTYAGPIGSTAISGSNTNIALNLASTNTGTLTLSNPSNAYSGGTTINGGTLLVSNAVGGSPTGSGAISVGVAGNFGSTGAGGGGVSGHVDNSGTLIPGGVGSAGVMSLSGGLTAEAGSNVKFDLGTSSDKIFLGGASDSAMLSAPGGSQSVNIDLFDPTYSIQNQTYALFSYPVTTTLSGLDTSVFKVVAPPTGVAQGAQFSITNNSASHEIDLTISGAGSYLTWLGDANGNGTWDVATTPNWSNNGTQTTFHTFDNVIFDDTANAGSGNGTISVTIPAGGVIPSQTTFNNTARNYVVTGGPIGGSGDLVKSGNGFLTLNGPNTYTGGTFINGGTLNTSEDSGLGAAGTPVALNGGTLQLGLSFNPVGRPFSVGANGGIIDTNGFNMTIDGPLTTNGAPGTFTKQGSGTLTLTNAANTFSGATVINNGALSIASPYTTITSITINASGTLQLAPNAGGTAINSATLVLNAGSTFDITNNTVTFSTTVTGHDANTLLAALKSAYDSGNWDHPGITSSLAAVSHGATTVGWNNNTTANTFTIRYTLPGDTNLDGLVDSNDLGNISPTGTTWASGDFNYDGVVNADDYGLYMLGAAYGDISAAPVPEPAGAALLAISAAIFFHRRRKV